MPTLAHEPPLALSDVQQLITFTESVPTFNRKNLLDRIVACGMVLRGHFELQSGLHSDIFMRFNSFADSWGNNAWAAAMLVDACPPSEKTVFVAADTAGLRLATALVEACGGQRARLAVVVTDARHHPTSVFDSDGVLSGERVVLVTDVLTTGEGLRAMRKTAEASGGQVVEAVMFASRVSDPNLLLGWDIPIRFLVRLAAPSWPVGDCDLQGELVESFKLN